MTENTDVFSSTDIALAVDSSHFESRKIQPLDDHSLLIKPTIAALAFSLLFVALGLVIAFLWSASRLTSFDGPDSTPLLLIGFLFLIAGLAMYYSSNEQLLITRGEGAKYIRSWLPAAQPEKASSYKLIPPQKIVAIQTISRLVKRRSNRSRRSSSYTEYQVNIVMEGDERHNAFITLKPDKAELLGNQLAEMFNVPIKAQ